ncbi:MAG: polyribonucleotide nucleotidyltransferase [Anaerolineales bacterium]|nr:polyribonucleotide nucleotidyltransferase [Anaerolineales bacterium]MCB8962132.1 polyribonucleotide nucleotidyltransferase [Ardenticatenales bacterium]
MKQDSIFTTTVGGQEVTFATGKLAEQAGGAVTIRTGDTLLLATATMSKNVREGMNFFPLSVDFEEKIYAAGRIPGSFFRREGRATTEGILTARVTDRALRPLFPDGMRNEVQVIVYALSSDNENLLDMLALNAASAALHISDVPWGGPVGAVRVGYIDNNLVINPTASQLKESRLDLRMAGSRDAIVMVEAGANEVPESLMVDALEFGHEAMQPLIDIQLQMREQVGKEKTEVVLDELDKGVIEVVSSQVGDRLKSAISSNEDRYERNEAVDVVRQDVIETLVTDESDFEETPVREALDKMYKKIVRDQILYDGVRPDGRSHSAIRELSAETGISPRVHGSGLFQRGETQVLSIVTLGTPREAEKMDGLFPEDTRRFMHHYNFPPFSTGETWFLRGPKRREIGHGMLAATAMSAVLPDENEFPYTIRVVSEVLSSNGSTSQGSICASILALMDCGVPISRPVAGVAMGLIKDGDKYAILTDIQGMEDHLGDMDFKVAGTSEGITALQMDIKIGGLTKELMAEALEQARVGRMEILDVMTDCIAEPRPTLSKWAPRMESISIDPEAIGAVIGKAGATVRGLQEEFDVTIDIQEDGTVFVAGVDGQKTDEAIARIKQIAKGPEIGDVILGKVVRITDFGAFVELLPGQDGMVHISQLSTERVASVEDAVQMGDQLMVMVTDVDPAGKIRLSRQAVMEGWTIEEARENDPALNRSRGGGDRDRGGRSGGRGGDRGGRGGDRGGRGGDRNGRGGDRGGDRGRSGGGDRRRERRD